MTATGTLKVDGQTINATLIKDTELAPEKRLNSHSVFSFTLQDKEGALYGTDIGGGTNWEDSMGKKVTFQHSDGTYNFVGRVERLTFKASSLAVYCQGESAYMRDYVLPASMGDNFILLSGLVSGDPTDYQGVVCTDGGGASPGWTPNQLEYTTKNYGVSFDGTAGDGEDTISWDASNPTVVTGTSTSEDGTAATTNTEDDSLYSLTDDSNTKDATVTFTLDGTDLNSSNYYVQSLTLYLKGQLSIESGGIGHYHKVEMQIYYPDTAEWISWSEWKVAVSQPGSTNYVSIDYGEDGLEIPEPWATRFLHDSDTDGDYDKVQIRFVL